LLDKVVKKAKGKGKRFGVVAGILVRKGSKVRGDSGRD